MALGKQSPWQTKPLVNKEFAEQNAWQANPWVSKV
jgi:hypothetical protein